MSIPNQYICRLRPLRQNIFSDVKAPSTLFPFSWSTSPWSPSPDPPPMISPSFSVHVCLLLCQKVSAIFIFTLYPLRILAPTAKPSAVINTRNVEAQRGASAIISCSVRGNPTPQITWRRDGQNVLRDQRFRILRNGSLYITRVREEDAGLYVLEASNSKGSSSDSTNLIVLSELR